MGMDLRGGRALQRVDGGLAARRDGRGMRTSGFIAVEDWSNFGVECCFVLCFGLGWVKSWCRY
jgi:hypothetical protein